MCNKRDRATGRTSWRRGAGVGGQSIVELALIFPLLSLFLIGALDLGRAYIDGTRLATAVMAGAIYGAHYPDSGTIADRAYAEANGRLGATPTDFTIAAADIRCYQGLSQTLIASTPAGNCAAKTAAGNLLVVPSDSIEVTGTYAFRPITSQLLRFLPSTFRIKRTARVVIQ
jgi:Flp pilus assembly protein TadG